MEKQAAVVCRTCGSPAEIFNAKADEDCIWFQCTSCCGIFLQEYQLAEGDAFCAICESPAKVFKATKNCLWLQCGNCGGIFKSEYQLIQPAAVSAE